MSHTYSLVREAVATMMVESPAETFLAIVHLALLEPHDVLPELFVSIEDAYQQVDTSMIFSAEHISDPLAVTAIASAVANQDLQGLQRAAPGDYAELLSALVATVAALERCRT